MGSLFESLSLCSRASDLPLRKWGVGLCQALQEMSALAFQPSGFLPGGGEVPTVPYQPLSSSPVSQAPPSPGPVSSAQQRISQSAISCTLWRVQLCPWGLACPLGPQVWQDLASAELFEPFRERLPRPPFLAMVCRTWVRAAVVGLEPAGHMAGCAHAQAGLLL